MQLEIELQLWQVFPFKQYPRTHDEQLVEEKHETQLFMQAEHAVLEDLQNPIVHSMHDVALVQLKQLFVQSWHAFAPVDLVAQYPAAQILQTVEEVQT